MNKLMRQFLLLTGIGSLAFSLACGGGGSNGGGGFGSGGGTGFSNASLNGHYAYQVKGYSLFSNDPLRETGVFTADGSGHITAGADDFSVDTNVSLDNVTGSYQINTDGTGSLLLNFQSGGSVTFAITMVSASKFYLVETDTGAPINVQFLPVSSGVGVKQDTTAFANVPSGTYITRMHTVTNAQISTSSVGAFTITNGVITGNRDTSSSGAAVSSSTITTGAFNFPDSTSGRGTGTFTDSISGPSTFIYYVVDASHLLLFSNVAGVQGNGQAEKQSAGPFSAASLSGPYAFGTGGDTTNFFEFSNSVGRFTADGSGGISAGVLDGSGDGIPAPNIPFTGTYTVTSNGRAAATFNATPGNVQQVYWLVSPSRAFSVLNSSSSVEDGSVDLQIGSFSNSSLSGVYGFEMDGFDTDSKQRLGTINFNGSGTLTLGEVSNAGGVSSSSGNLTGTYSVASNGRVTGSVNSLSNNLVFYMVSSTDAYVLQNDTSVAIKGSLSKQSN